MQADVVTARPGEALTWARCKRCHFAGRGPVAGICGECSNDMWDEACSYGGTAAEMTARYVKALEKLFA